MFQQDGALPHWARIFQEYLVIHFSGHWVGCEESIPPRSPDIMPLHFFLWGYVTDIVCKPPPPDLPL
jgi:hypothetical protein